MNNQTNDQKIYVPKQPKNNRNILGIIIILIGSAFLLRSVLPIIVPRWIFSWKVLLMVIGVLIGTRDNFRGNSWWILITIGAVFLINDQFVSLDFIKPILFPSIIIIIGILIILRNRRNKEPRVEEYMDQYSPGHFTTPPATGSEESLLGPIAEHAEGDAAKNQYQKEYSSHSYLNNDDYLSVNSVFGGTKRIVMSKSFKGGKVTSIFGGAEIDLRYADISGVIVIDIFCAFGGVEVHLPTGWYVKNEITPIMAGVEDNRFNVPAPNQGKVVILRGTVMFGGVEIRN